MTIRSSANALQRQKLRRAQTLCTLFEVTRRDGFVLRFTDHDRVVTQDGYQFSPLGLGSISAERREAGMRAGNQEARGAIDGSTITIPDMMGRRYVGALVVQQVVDWRMPWVWHRRSHKRIRSVTQDGSSWVATLEGLGASMQQPDGGRFGGTYSRECGYVWGDPSTCRADRMTGLQYGPSLGFTATAATTTSLTDSSATWTPDQWVGWHVVVSDGTQRGDERIITSNDADTVSWSEPLDAAPSIGDPFVIGNGATVDAVIDDRMVFEFTAGHIVGTFADDYYRDGEVEWTVGANAGLVSPVVGYIDTPRRVSLLLPTPFSIQVGDQAILRTGCNGLKQTCIDKFSNVENFGGTDVYATRPGDALEQVT